MIQGRPRDFDAIAIGAELPALEWTATLEDMKAFASLLPVRSDDPLGERNPHVSEAFAKTQIYGALFVDGNHTVAHLCRMVTDWAPPGSLVSGYSDVDMRFPNPCRIGDVAVFRGSVSDKRVVEGRNIVSLSVEGATKEGKVIATGRMDAYVPS